VSCAGEIFLRKEKQFCGVNFASGIGGIADEAYVRHPMDMGQKTNEGANKGEIHSEGDAEGICNT
jgi:hypothetical protein